jgi:hypothetical protein
VEDAMSDPSQISPGIDLARHLANRRLIPASELERYAGQHVAFSADGTRVVAAGVDPEAVVAELRRRGIEQSAVVWSYVPAADEATWL